MKSETEKEKDKLPDSSTVYLQKLLCFIVIYSKPATGNSLQKTLRLVMLYNRLIHLLPQGYGKT